MDVRYKLGVRSQPADGNVQERSGDDATVGMSKRTVVGAKLP